MVTTSTPAHHDGNTLTAHGVIRRFFTTEGCDPLESVSWTKRSVALKDSSGRDVFRQDGVEVPDFWSDRAATILARHYFRGRPGTPQRETSLKQVSHRVAHELAQAGERQGLLKGNEPQILYDELRFIVVHQLAAFNSPVWYNVGVEDDPQGSACFILNVEDSLLDGPDSITASIGKEARIFKHGSGSGMNLSRLRETNAPLSGGGVSSGVPTFMRTLDTHAGGIKSGGKTRRAACLRRLDADHPDIGAFIGLKVREDEKLRALVAAGFDGSLAGEAEQSISYQNANHSVGVTDQFMRMALGEEMDTWVLRTRAPHAGGVDVPGSAGALFQRINECAHRCADPGLQFHDTIQSWHTVPEDGEVRCSNPCSEFLHLDDTSCNLASLNLCRLGPLDARRVPTAFSWPDTNVLRHVADVLFTSQEILVGLAGYPTPQIRDKTREFRPLGLSYGNLGALLMANGVGYGSDEGRRIAGALACLMTGRAYRDSAAFAAVVGPFAGYARNRRHVERVLLHHRDAALRLLSSPMWPDYPGAKNGQPHPVPTTVMDWVNQSLADWDVAVDAVGPTGCGIRNSQATLLAPTGTIGFMLDFDSTSGEPVIALSVTKTMVDKSVEHMPFRPLERALLALQARDPSRFRDDRLRAVLEHIAEHGHAGDLLRPDENQILSCALPAADGGGAVLTPDQHVLMVAAIQPFLSGAISKTVNMPASATVEDVARIHALAWRSGCKAVALYRDGSKQIQVLSTGAKHEAPSVVAPLSGRVWGERDCMPTTGPSVRHKFVIGGSTKGYLHIGEVGGRPREIFLKVSKTGGALAGLVDAWARSMSFNLQLGMPLEKLVDGFRWQQFEPSGFTDNPDVPSCTSIADYVVRFMEVRYLGGSYLRQQEDVPREPAPSPSAAVHSQRGEHSGPCAFCGGFTTRNGTCNVCTICGETSGCS